MEKCCFGVGLLYFGALFSVLAQFEEIFLDYKLNILDPIFFIVIYNVTVHIISSHQVTFSIHILKGTFETLAKNRVIYSFFSYEN